MADMILKATGSELKIKSAIHVTSTQAQYDRCVFELDSAWNSYGTRTAVFYSGNPYNVKAVLLDTNNICYIPWDSFGPSRYLYIGLYGSNGSSYLPTNFVEIMYKAGANIDDHAYPPTPGIYEQLLTFMNNGISNPNILHNWDFRKPVNQRGLSGLVTGNNIYFLDRWFLTQGTLFVQNNNLVVNSDSPINQRIEGINLSGKTLTFSIMLQDGDVYKHTCDVPMSADVIISDKVIFRVTQSENGYMQLKVNFVTQQTILAVKLEVGSISTLHLDPPMDRAVELPKCQRFFVNLGAYPMVECYSLASGTQMYGKVMLPVAMRAIPTISSTDAVMYTTANEYKQAVLSNFTLYGNVLRFNATGTNFPLNIPAIGYINGTKVTASADL